uniref:Uncharacterized protein MANES_17G066500 n=1 Tax=Rhizophora mucronata TaxID=61149 RepID=A0A2P2KNE3_RHIMU
MLFVLFGQSATILMARLYYSKGGKSKWMVTLAQLTGFPVLIPYYSILPSENPTTDSLHRRLPLTSLLASIYILFGIFLAANTMMYSVGILYLPIHTFLFLCAFQMTFTAFFSSYLHLQSFSSSKIVSPFLLSTPSILLVFGSDSAKPGGVPNGNYAAAFTCTIVASAGYGLLLSLMQLSIRKVLEQECNYTKRNTGPRAIAKNLIFKKATVDKTDVGQNKATKARKVLYHLWSDSNT